MDIPQDKQQERQAHQPDQSHQVAQPAEESLKNHGDQLEKPLHDALAPDGQSKEGDRANDNPGGQR